MFGLHQTSDFSDALFTRDRTSFFSLFIDFSECCFARAPITQILVQILERWTLGIFEQELDDYGALLDLYCMSI